MKWVVLLMLIPSCASADWTCKDVQQAVRLAGTPESAERIARLSGVSEIDIANAKACIKVSHHRLRTDRASAAPDKR